MSYLKRNGNGRRRDEVDINKHKIDLFCYEFMVFKPNWICAEHVVSSQEALELKI